MFIPPEALRLLKAKPTIDNIDKSMCPLYKITGKLFNGISEGAAYGDDWEMSTNYPIVRLTNGTDVYYARTTNWNRIGAVKTDSLEDTAYFTLPASLPLGTYSLVVVANGNPSNPVMFTPCVTGVNEVKAESEKVKVYPNPNKGEFTLEVQSEKLKVKSIEVYNVLGEKVTPTLPADIAGLNFSYQINISSQPSGVYFYRVIGEDGKMIGEGKVVISK